MATARPFAYNTGSPIPGTEQLGDLSIGAPLSGFTDNPQFWNGPDEELGYIIGYTVTAGNQPNPVGIPAYVQFWRSKLKTNESFLELANYIGLKNGQPPFANVGDASTWLNANGYYTSFVEVGPTSTPTPTPTVTETTTSTPTPSVTNTQTPTTTTTNTPTPSITNTQTPSVTPTNTPTPSTSPIPVTGYGFNLVALPYNYPTTGNTIMNSTNPIVTGSTNPNELNIVNRGIYFNAIDKDGVDRTSYFAQFTGQSITLTMSQTGSTAIYSGDSKAFQSWSGNTGDPGAPIAGKGFVFGYGIAQPGYTSGTTVLVQSATTNWVTGQTVYISAVVNGAGATPTPTVTSTNTPTPSVTNTQTPSVTPTNTPTVTPTNPSLLQILNQTTGSRTVTSFTIDGTTQTLSSGSYPITAGNNGYALTHGTNSNPNGVVFNFGGSGLFDLYSYVNGVLVNYLASYNSSSYTMGGLTLQTSDQLLLRITDTGAIATPTPTPSVTSTLTPTPTTSVTPEPTTTPTNTGTPTQTPTPTPTSGATSSGLSLTLVESNGNVVMTASGSLNINDLTLVNPTSGPYGGGGIGVTTATFLIATAGLSAAQYSGFTSTPSNFGPGGAGASPSSVSGDIFGVIFQGAPPYSLLVPTGYTTGTAISSTQTFVSQTFSSLGLTPGTYTYSWGSGANADSINVVVGGAGVTPTPTATSVTPTPTPTSGSTGVGWFFYSPNNQPVLDPPSNNGDTTFINTGDGYGTYNPNYTGGTLSLYFNNNDRAGTSYASQFSTLVTAGGTMTISQGSSTVIYSGTSTDYQSAGGTFTFLNVTRSAQMIQSASTPFVSGTSINVVVS